MGITVRQVLRAIPWGGPCCDDETDCRNLVAELSRVFGFGGLARLALFNALMGKPWATDDKTDRRKIAREVCKVLNAKERV